MCAWAHEARQTRAAGREAHPFVSASTVLQREERQHLSSWHAVQLLRDLAAHAEHPDQPCAFAQVDGYASVAKELRSRAMSVESRGPEVWPLIGAAETAKAFIAMADLRCDLLRHSPGYIP